MTATGRMASWELCERYRSDGVVVLHDVVPTRWLERLRAAVDHYAAEEHPEKLDLEEGRGRRFTIGAGASRHYPVLTDFYREHPGLVDTLRCLAGARQSLRLLDDQIFVKERRTTTVTPWHHDITYWAIAGDQVLSLWVALDDVDTASGGLEFVAGSHRWPEQFTAVGIVPTPEMHDPAHVDAPSDQELRRHYRVIADRLCAGDGVAFHARTLHFAGGNATADRRRRGFVTRWVGEDVVYAPRPYSSPRHIEAAEAMALRPGDRLHGEAFPLFWSGD